MLTPITTRKMVMRPKKMMVWTSIAIPLVCMFPNSTTLLLPGNWNSNPGLNSTNSTTAITTAPQSAIFFSWFFFRKSTNCSSDLKLFSDMGRDEGTCKGDLELISDLWCYCIEEEGNEYIKRSKEREYQ